MLINEEQQAEMKISGPLFRLSECSIYELGSTLFFNGDLQ